VKEEYEDTKGANYESICLKSIFFFKIWFLGK